MSGYSVDRECAICGGTGRVLITNSPASPDAVDAAIEKAQAELSALCGGKRFLMSIPARPDADSDIVIGTALAFAKHHVAALRAEVAALKSDEERLDWLEKWLPEQPGHRRLVFDRSVPEFTLFQSDDNVRRLGMKKTLRAAIDAARAASGEDASR